MGETDWISKQAVIEAVKTALLSWSSMPQWRDDKIIDILAELPSAQPEIIRCKDCEYGEQDEVGRWFCRSLGCQIGNEDGSGYCADAERRTDNANANA